MSQIPRTEYPRPQFERTNWLCLNGEWDFSFETDTFDRVITVPYVYQSELSGIHSNLECDVVWYRKRFELSGDMYHKRIILHFGAVDYACRVWVNGNFVKEHVGGHVSFEVEITDVIHQASNEIRLEVSDPVRDLEMPRGKQYWKESSESIFYTRSTGIWQSVWLEAVSSTFLRKVWFTPDFDELAINIQYEIDGSDDVSLETEIRFEDTLVANYTTDTLWFQGSYSIGLDQQILNLWQFHEEMVWTPENPRLFDVVFKLRRNSETIDRVTSYFGMREITIRNGKLLLNNRPYYQKLLLDQGYWRESLLTAPDDEAFVTDIRLAKEMGFNGVRKHQKVEDPRFMYHADRMGFLVWGEIAAAYVYSRKYVKRITDEWMEAVSRDYNHPCIVAWTPLNESWGVTQIATDKMQQSHSAAMVYLTRSLDRTRPVISNDGWEHTVTDLLTIHDYEGDKAVLKERYKNLVSILDQAPAGRALFAEGWDYQGQPILVTEFGGISYIVDEAEGWGYTSAKTADDFAARYHAVVSALLESPLVQGFCYTQITDVEQETNGLLTFDRKPKIDPAIIRRINEGRYEGNTNRDGF